MEKIELYILTELNKIYPNHMAVSSIIKGYDLRELKDIVNNSEYIEKVSPTYLVKINIKGIEYLNEIHSSPKKISHKPKRDIIKIIGIIFVVLTFILSVITQWDKIYKFFN